MNRITAFSEDILTIVFNNIESLQQLVIFSKEIVVNSELQAFRAYRYFVLGRTKAKFIINVRFNFDEDKTRPPS